MLSRKYRLVARKDFQTILKKGQTAHGRFFFIKYLPSLLPHSVFGFVVSTKVDKRSSKRNYIKRLLADQVRLYILPRLTTNVKVVLVARTLIINKQNRFIQDDLTEVFSRRRLIKIL